MLCAVYRMDFIAWPHLSPLIHSSVCLVRFRLQFHFVRLFVIHSAFGKNSFCTRWNHCMHEPIWNALKMVVCWARALSLIFASKIYNSWSQRGYISLYFMLFFVQAKTPEPLKMSVKRDDGSIQMYGENDERKIIVEIWSMKQKLRNTNVESNNNNNWRQWKSSSRNIGARQT